MADYPNLLERDYTLDVYDFHLTINSNTTDPLSVNDLASGSNTAHWIRFNTSYINGEPLGLWERFIRHIKNTNCRRYG
jgi:hypothetical protein